MLEGLANRLARDPISELEPTIAIGQDAQAIRAEGRSQELVFVLDGLAEGIVRRRLPESDRTIIAPRQDARTVGAEGDRVNRASLS